MFKQIQNKLTENQTILKTHIPSRESVQREPTNARDPRANPQHRLPHPGEGHSLGGTSTVCMTGTSLTRSTIFSTADATPAFQGAGDWTTGTVGGVVQSIQYERSLIQPEGLFGGEGWITGTVGTGEMVCVCLKHKHSGGGGEPVSSYLGPKTKLWQPGKKSFVRNNVCINVTQYNKYNGSLNKTRRKRKHVNEEAFADCPCEGTVRGEGARGMAGGTSTRRSTSMVTSFSTTRSTGTSTSRTGARGAL